MVHRSIYRRHLIYSIGFHALLFFILAMGFEHTNKPFVYENSDKRDIINATVMNAVPASKPDPVPSSLPISSAVKPMADIIPQPLKTQPLKVQQVKPEPIKQAIAKPVEKLQVVKSDVIALDNKKQKTQKEVMAKQLLLDLKKQQALHKKVKQKALEEAFENEIKNLSVKKQQLQKERQRALAEKEQKMQGEVDKYKALVLQSIGQKWLIPEGVNKKLSTKIMIYLAPGGTVLNAEIYESSGNVALDNSARAATFKASPLPVPADAEEFKFFKRFVLVFRPMNFQKGQFDLGASTSLNQDLKRV